MKIGIVGSRERNGKEDQEMVFKIVKDAIDKYGHRSVHLVSGGCPEGADRFAEMAADYFGLSITVHYPIKQPPAKNKQEAVQRFFGRNLIIARDSNIVYALVRADRQGGTENTIKHCLDECRDHILVMPDGSYVHRYHKYDEDADEPLGWFDQNDKQISK